MCSADLGFRVSSLLFVMPAWDAAVLAVLHLGVVSAAAVCAPGQAGCAGSRDFLRQGKVEIPCYRTQRPGEQLG